MPCSQGRHEPGAPHVDRSVCPPLGVESCGRGGGKDEGRGSGVQATLGLVLQLQEALTQEGPGWARPKLRLPLSPIPDPQL